MPVIFEGWFEDHGVEIRRARDLSCYCYRIVGVQIDADGAPNAYHPGNTGALDVLGNAGYPNGSWQDILVPDPDDRRHPYIQKDGPFAGFYVSQTALRSDGPDTQCSTYVDASKINFIVFPGAFEKLAGTGSVGDFVGVLDLTTGHSLCGVVGDIGPEHDPLSEISFAMAQRLSGKPVNAVTNAGAPENPLLFVVFPHTRKTPPWPLDDITIDEESARRINALGGWTAVAAAFAAP